MIRVHGVYFGLVEVKSAISDLYVFPDLAANALSFYAPGYSIFWSMKIFRILKILDRKNKKHLNNFYLK